jgi:hypothetical protein
MTEYELLKHKPQWHFFAAELFDQTKRLEKEETRHLSGNTFTALTTLEISNYGYVF